RDHGPGRTVRPDVPGRERVLPDGRRVHPVPDAARRAAPAGGWGRGGRARVRRHAHPDRGLLQHPLVLRRPWRTAPARGRRPPRGAWDLAKLPARTLDLPRGDAHRLREPPREPRPLRRLRALLCPGELALRSRPGRLIRQNVPVRISAKADYAVRATAELAAAAAAGKGPVKGEQIATAQSIPLQFLLHILTELTHARIVQ